MDAAAPAGGAGVWGKSRWKSLVSSLVAQYTACAPFISSLKNQLQHPWRSLRGRRRVNCETKAAVDGTAHRELALAPGRRSFVGRRRLQEKQHRFDGLVPSLVTRLALGACSLARLLGGRFDIARGLGACAKRGLAPSGAATRELQWRRRGRREVAEPGAAPLRWGRRGARRLAAGGAAPRGGGGQRGARCPQSVGVDSAATRREARPPPPPPAATPLRNPMSSYEQGSATAPHADVFSSNSGGAKSRPTARRSKRTGEKTCKSRPRAVPHGVLPGLPSGPGTASRSLSASAAPRGAPRGGCADPAPRNDERWWCL